LPVAPRAIDIVAGLDAAGIEREQERNKRIVAGHGAHRFLQGGGFGEQPVVADASENGAEQLADGDAIFMVALDGIEVTHGCHAQCLHVDGAQDTACHVPLCALCSTGRGITVKNCHGERHAGAAILANGLNRLR